MAKKAKKSSKKAKTKAKTPKTAKSGKKKTTAAKKSSKKAKKAAAKKATSKKAAAKKAGTKKAVTKKTAPKKSSRTAAKKASSKKKAPAKKAAKAPAKKPAPRLSAGKKAISHGGAVLISAADAGLDAPAPRPKKRSPQATKKLKAGLSRIRQQLFERKAALVQHLQNELAELEHPEKRHRADLEEMASDTHDTSSLCEIMDMEASQIGQINMALNKIDEGTYGVCEDCSGEIPLARLEALPFATQCVECKRRAEMASPNAYGSASIFSD